MAYELREFQKTGAAWLQSMPRAALLDEAGLGKSAQLLIAAKGKTLVIAPAMILDAGTWDRERQLWAPDLDLTTVAYTSLCERVAVCPANTDGKGNGHQVPVDEVLTLVGKAPTGRQLKSGKPQLKKISRTVCPICWDGYTEPTALPEDPRHWRLVYRTLERARREFLRAHWDTIICDEAQYLKGRDTSWSVAVRALTKRDPDQVWLATGTAIPNWAYELFVPLQILRPDDAKRGQGPLSAFWTWADRWFVRGVQRGPGGKVVSEYKLEPRLRACTEECDLLRWDQDCVHWEAFRKANLFDSNGTKLFLGRLRDDVLTDLPPLLGWEDENRRPILFKVKMTAEQRRVYDQLKEEYVAWCDDDTEIAAWSGAALQERLRQVATGLSTADPSQLVNPHASGKMKALREILESRGRRPTLVAAHYQNTMSAMAQVCDTLGREWAEISGRTPDKTYRRETVERFQAGDLPVLLGSIDTIAEGLTLTAADLFVLVETSYRPDRNQQVARRLHRLGQTRPVTAIRMVSENSIDEGIQDLLVSKTIHQLRALPPHEIAKIL